MTQKRYTEIPRRFKSIASDDPYVAGAEDIEAEEGKNQKQLNEETDERIATEVGRAQQAESTLDGKIAAEKTRAEGVEGGLNTRLQTVEQLAEISVGGGDIGIGTAADFESDNPEDLAKVPTIGAMLGGANDGVYDISARHNGTKYADLETALGTNGANIPQNLRKGGISVKFVQSSDNKYVQARFMLSGSFTDAQFTNADNWQGIDAEPIASSKNLVESGGVYPFNQLYDGKLYDENVVVNENTILFTNKFIQTSDILHYSISNVINTTGAIAFFDSNNTRITYIGWGSAASEVETKEGNYTIPANFAYCKVIWGKVTVNSLKINNTNILDIINVLSPIPANITKIEKQDELILGSRAPITFSGNDITIGTGYIYIRRSENILINYNHSTEETFTLGGNKCLVINKNTKAISVIDSSEVTSDHWILLWKDNVAGIVGGLIYNHYFQDEIISNFNDTITKKDNMDACSRASVSFYGNTVVLGSGYITIIKGRKIVTQIYNSAEETFDLSGNKFLVYNYTTRLFSVVAAETVLDSTDLVMLWHDNSEGFCGGLLYKYYMQHDENTAINIPSDYAQEVVRVSNVLKTKEANAAIMLNIITDTHERYWVKSDVEHYNLSLECIRKINQNVKCNKFISLGDILKGDTESGKYKTQEICNSQLYDFFNRMREANDDSIILLGNHDGINTSTPTETGAYPAIGINAYCSRVQDKPYYYYDNSSTKVRCIFLAMPYSADGKSAWAFGEEQINWLIDIALNTSDNTHCIFFCHVPLFNPDITGGNEDVQGVINAYNNHTSFTTSYGKTADFSGKTGTKSVAWVCGHVHADRVWTNSDTGYFTGFNLVCPMIMIYCHHRYGNDSTPIPNAITPTKTPGTVTEDSWDTLVYDKENSKIYMIRFGAGSDREIDV